MEQQEDNPMTLFLNSVKERIKKRQKEHVDVPEKPNPNKELHIREIMKEMDRNEQKVKERQRRLNFY